MKKQYFLLGILILLLAAQQWPAFEETHQLTQASRLTELGKIHKAKKTSQKEKSFLNDPAMSKAWGFQDKHTAIQKAWKKLKAYGSKRVVVAIIDTGIDVSHPDLQNNLWTNPGEVGIDDQGNDKSTNGIDDDGNGYVDDVHGWNFVNNSPDLTDNHGHGTHIAGIIGAEGGNGIGISGVSPRVSLMILKYFDPKAPQTNNLINTVRAIKYAIKMKANIINYSGGGLQPSEEEKQAIALAAKHNILFVAAAGNEQSNSDNRPYYPADYPLSNIISVTAFDRTQNILPSSNFGERTVDIAAPGNNIYSTLPHNSYGYMTGTSQATAFVTGVAALILARFPDFKPSQIIRHINNTGDFAPHRLAGKTRYKKRLNAFRALSMLDHEVNVDGSITTNTQNMKPISISSAPTTTASTSEPLVHVLKESQNILQALKRSQQIISGEVKAVKGF